MRELPFQPHLVCRQIPEEYETPDNTKNNTYSYQDSKAVSRDTAIALARVKERIRIEAFSGMGNIGESKIAC